MKVPQQQLQNYANNNPEWPNATTTWDNRYIHDGDDSTPNMVGNTWKSHSNNKETTDGDISEQFKYDQQGNITNHSYNINDYGSKNYDLNYTYNCAGMHTSNKDSVTGLINDVSYNTLNQITGVSATLNSVRTNLSAYSYTQTGHLAKTTLLPSDNNTSILDRNYTYMSTEWPKAIDDNNMTENLQYTQESCDNKGYYTGAIANQSIEYKTGQTQTDEYCFIVDYLNRITTANNSKSSDTWAQDSNGNVESHTIDNVTRSYTTMPNGNRLQSISSTDKSFERSYGYTNNGQISTIKDENSTLKTIDYYKASNLPQKIAINNDNKDISFQYSSQDERSLKTVTSSNGQKSQCLYIHGLSHLPTIEINKDEDENEIVKRFIHLPGCVALLYEGKYYFVSQDHIGSTRTIIDESGEVVGQYNYDIYGNPTTIKTPGFPYNYLYTNQEYEEETNLYNYKARLYDPEIGRFLMVDPAMQYASPYIYAGNNPMLYIDPTGEFSWRAFSAAMGALAIIGGVALTIATAGAATPILIGATIASGALIGAGVSSDVYAIGHSDKNFNPAQYGEMVGLGAGFGAVTGGVSLGIGSAGLSAGATFGAEVASQTGLGGLDNYVTNGVTTGKWTGKEAGLAAGMGALMGGVSAGVLGGGARVGSKLYNFNKNIMTNELSLNTDVYHATSDIGSQNIRQTGIIDIVKLLYTMRKLKFVLSGSSIIRATFC